MFRLSREIRFAIDPLADAPRPLRGRNGHAASPPITSVGQCYYCLVATLVGEPEADTGYLINIKTIDKTVRQRGIPLMRRAISRTPGSDQQSASMMLLSVFRELSDAFAPHALDALELRLSPNTSLVTSADLFNGPNPMVLLHHNFEFAASHRLHNPAFSEAKNYEIFGKCNNPHGHGHNYVLRVTLRGEAAGTDLLAGIDELERVVGETVIEPFDHKHLNLEVPEFADLNPSVENIAMVIYGKLAGPLSRGGAVLDSVTIWETPRTWAEYRE